MKLLLLLLSCCVLTACANPNENAPPDPRQVKKENRVRDDFAKSLPKPPER